MLLPFTYPHTSTTCEKRSKKVAVDDADNNKRGGEGGRGAAQVKIKGFHLRHHKRGGEGEGGAAQVKMNGWHLR